jgi:hypothetical protein
MASKLVLRLVALYFDDPHSCWLMGHYVSCLSICHVCLSLMFVYLSCLSICHVCLSVMLWWVPFPEDSFSLKGWSFTLGNGMTLTFNGPLRKVTKYLHLISTISWCQVDVHKCYMYRNFFLCDLNASILASIWLD